MQLGSHCFILSGIVTCIFALFLLDCGLCLDEHRAFFVFVYWYLKGVFQKAFADSKSQRTIKERKREREREIERGILN